jgi:hypothetical protein
MRIYIRKLRYRMRRQGLGSNQFQARSPDTVHPTLELPWEISLEAYQRLVTAPCFYCGTLPNQTPHGMVLQRQGIKRNGIDRVDNSKGYSESNCVPCCRICNWEKGAQSQAEFIENTRRRYEHLCVSGHLTAYQV